MNSESSNSYGTPLLNFLNSNSNQSNVLGNPTLYQQPNNQLELPGDRPSHFVLNSMASRGWPHADVPTEITRDLNHNPNPGTEPIFSSQISSFHQALQNRQQPLPPGIPLPGNPVNIQHAQTLKFQRNLDVNGLNSPGIHSQFHRQNPLNQVGQLREMPTRNSQQHGQLQPNQSTLPSTHVPPVRSAQQLESDMLVEIADFNAATSEVAEAMVGSLVSLVEQHQQQQLEPEIMEELDRTELNQAYFAYQREIYLLICKQKLHVNPPLEHLGLLTRIWGATNYINYCRYDEVASVTYYDQLIHVNNRMKLCGQLWKQVDDDIKEKWKDPDYVESKMCARGQPENDNQLKGTVSLSSIRKSRFKINEWARKMKKDVSSSWDPESNLLITGGSLLGDDQFVDMMNHRVPNPCKSFFGFVSGQVAIQQVSGLEPTVPVKTNSRATSTKNTEPEDVHCLGGKDKNLSAVRQKLSNAISPKIEIGGCRTIGGADEDLESSQEANDTGRTVVCVGTKRPQKKMAAKKTKATKSNPTTNHRANRARANKKKNTGHTKYKRKRVVIEDLDTKEDSIPITNNPKKKQKHIEIEDDGGSSESFDGSRLDDDNVLTGDPMNI
ncbi:hypothetical protein PtB15_3B504 [Puccinia triticina]|nr:hypothetical protein PtB15_3B504 [Puccinia triticina]